MKHGGWSYEQNKHADICRDDPFVVRGGASTGNFA
jgi:hypothetical protein